MKYRILISLLLGATFVALVYITIDVTWIFGIALLMPGITLLQNFSFFRHFDPAPIPAIAANLLVYSVATFILVTIVCRLTRSECNRKLAKITALVALSVVLASWMATRALVSYGFGPCRNQATQYSSSPGGQHRAVIFYRDCGATTGFETNISILKGLDVINHSQTGNVFVASGWLTVQVHWTSPTQVMVTYPAGSKPILKKRIHDAVVVDYAERAPGK